MMAFDLDMHELTDDAYIHGVDAGRIAAKTSLTAADALEIDLYAWRAAAPVIDTETEQAFRDGWSKSYGDTRLKLRLVAARAVARAG